jgi:hypothetical protein
MRQKRSGKVREKSDEAGEKSEDVGEKSNTARRGTGGRGVRSAAVLADPEVRAGCFKNILPDDRGQVG